MGGIGSFEEEDATVASDKIMYGPPIASLESEDSQLFADLSNHNMHSDHTSTNDEA